MNPFLFPTQTPHLILGAAKSGKSAYAESLVLASPRPALYIATAKVLDDEMELRVRKHRERRTDRWETLECPIGLVEALRSLQGQGKVVLVDCLTLWLTNILLDDIPDPEPFIQDLCHLLPHVDYPLYLVSNEVGAGIVPENALARRFRDLAGWTNQKVAAVSPRVTLVLAGLPLPLKDLAAPP